MSGKISLQKSFLTVLESFEKEPALRAMNGFTEDVARLKLRMQDDVFRIAVVGEFSSGKSTFINAILGKDVLSHASRETTAVLTQIVNVPAGDRRVGTGLVRRRDGTQQTIRMEELREYTTTMSKAHAVAEEIAGVEIYTPLLHAERPLMLIDTPGLNGVASGHLDQTIRVVQEAHACIYLLQQRGMTKEDRTFLRSYLLPNQQNFIFVQNFIDAFNPNEGESVAQRLPLLEKMLREEVFAGSESHTFCVCGVSALKELAGQDRSITYLYEDSTDELDDGARAQLRAESNFASFRALMEENFNERRLAEIQYRGTANAILQWTKSLLQRIAHRAEEARAIYKVSREHRAIEKLERLQQRLKEAWDGNLAALDGFIRRRTDDAAKEIQEALTEGGAQTEREMREALAACLTFEEIQRKKGEIPAAVARHLGAVQQKLVGDVQASMQLLHQMIVERIEEYSGIAGKVAQVQAPPARSLPALKAMESGESSAVGHWENEIAQLRVQGEKLRREQAARERELQAAQRTVQNLAAEADGARRAQRGVQDDMRALGSRPNERVWQEEVEVERGGIFGAILDIFSTKTETRTMRDDSAGEDWDKDYRELQVRQNMHAARYDEIWKKKMEKERLLRRCQENAAENTARMRRYEDELRAYEERLKEEKEKDEMQRKYAMQAYLNQCRKQLNSWVHRHLYGADDEGGEVQRLCDVWRQNLAAGRSDMERRAHAMYEEAMRAKLAQLEQAKQEKSPALMYEVQDLTRAQSLLAQGVHQMEGDLA